jgi:hypothetical protein
MVLQGDSMRYVVLLLLAAIALSGCGKGPEPSDIVFANPKQAVVDARNMIAAKQMNSALYADWLYPKDLPESLRVAGLKCASVHDDHINLLVQRIPDWWVGARIWSPDSKRKHEDAKSRYKDIFFFTYSNDFPDSPTNIR